MPLLLDTGVVYALADADDSWHDRARALLSRQREPLLVPVTAVPEITCLLRKRLRPQTERLFLESIVGGELGVEALTADDWRRSVELLETYSEIGFVDASVVAIAERLRLTTIATTDRRHFSKIRPHHVDAFDLVP
jgi:hypothetical protein